MKKYLFLFCLFALSLSSCSSDDDSISNAPTVVGEWKIEVLKMNGDLINPDGFAAIMSVQAIDLKDSDRLIFKGDNSYLSSSNGISVKIIVKMMGQEFSETTVMDSFGNGTWRQNGNDLILTFDGQSTVYKIDFLSESTLQLSSSEEITTTLSDEMQDFHGTIYQNITLKR